MPAGVGWVEESQRLGAVQFEHTKTHEFNVPIGREGHGLEEVDRREVDRLECRGFGAEQCELVGFAASTTRDAVVDSARECLEALPDIGMEHLQLLRRQAGEAELTGEPVGCQGTGSDEFAQCAASGSQEHFETEGPVLPLTESERVPGVVVGLGLDVGDAVTVSADDDRASNALYGECTVES